VAYEIWFKLDGIEAGLAEGARRGWSPLLSISQSVQSGRHQGQPFQFTNLMRVADRSTPQFLRAAAEARHFREALVEFVAPDGGRMRLRLQDVTLQNVSLNGGPQAQEPMPMEAVTLEASRAEWSFVPAEGREVKASWPPAGAPAPEPAAAGL
jgi:type VI protein secretion system component Hcp